MMRWAKAILLAVLVAGLAAYAVDCRATTPEQAMRCCKSMPCSSQGHHGRDCCKTVGAMHAPFVLPSLVHAAGVSVVAAVFSTSTESILLQSVVGGSSARYHSPPAAQSLSLRPLRI